MPRTTEQAQYSLAFPVAAALVCGRIGVDEVSARGLTDPRVRRLVAMIRAEESAEFSRRFPAERWARVRIGLVDRRTLVSEPAQARGGPENPLGDDELRAKYRELAAPVIGVARAERIEHAVGALTVEQSALPTLLEDLLQPAVQRH